jgi:hypothetical protein
MVLARVTPKTDQERAELKRTIPAAVQFRVRTMPPIQLIEAAMQPTAEPALWFELDRRAREARCESIIEWVRVQVAKESSLRAITSLLLRGR